MSLSQVLDVLPAFTFEERQILIRHVIELDDPPLSEADEVLVESRLSATTPTLQPLYIKNFAGLYADG
jgi:hypothetical protein